MAKKGLKINKVVYFDELTHTYLTSKGVELIGVTTLMRMMGVAPNYANIAPDVLDRAARRGSATHKAIECYCNGCEVEIDEEFASETILNLEAFKRLGLNVLASEYLVSDNEHIASSIDLVLKDMSLVDIKTTSEVHWDAVAWQLSIYKYLFELQNKDKQVKRLQVLHLRGGKAQLSDVQELPAEQVQALIKSYLDGVTYVRPSSNDYSLIVDGTTEQAITLLAQLEDKIITLKEQIKTYEDEQKTLKDKVLSLMESNNIKKWDVSDTLSLTYVAPSVRETLDSKRLKEEQPTIYQEFIKRSQTKASLRINIKK